MATEVNVSLLAACEVLGIDPERTTSLRFELDSGGHHDDKGPLLVAHWEGRLRLTRDETTRVLEAVRPVQADGD